MRLLPLVVALSSLSAYAADANWTGKQRNVTTVTGQSAISCEYDYAGQKFWRTFRLYLCPMTVEVE